MGRFANRTTCRLAPLVLAACAAGMPRVASAQTWSPTPLVNEANQLEPLFPPPPISGDIEPTLPPVRLADPSRRSDLERLPPTEEELNAPPPPIEPEVLSLLYENQELEPPRAPPDPLTDVAAVSMWQRGDPWGTCFFYRGSGLQEPGNWIVGTGDRLGMISMPVFGSEDWVRDKRKRIRPNFAIHWLSGPKQVDLPPRTYDFSMAFGMHEQLAPFIAYEVACQVGFYSDFEGSARDGLRFPSHALLYLMPTDNLQLTLGIDWLDRDDVEWLPVFGVTVKPHSRIRFDAVFPKPRIAVRIGEEHWIYVSAEMGGGQWAIERADWTNDVVAYRDYRILLGVRNGRSGNSEGGNRFLEVGYVFDRRLEYRSGTIYKPLDTSILRSVIMY